MRLVRNKIVKNADIYSQNNVEPTSISSLLDTLKAAFNPQPDLSQLQAEMSNIIQGNNESFPQYGIRVSEILRRTLDAIAVSCFTRGLHESIEN